MQNQIRTFATAIGLIALSTAAIAAEPAKVVIGGGVYLDVPQLAVADDRNLWVAHDIEAQTIPFQSGRDAFEALLGGQLDIAFIAEFPAVIGAMRDQDFALLAEMTRYKGTRIIHAGGDGIASIADLDGKPIGVTAGTNVHFMLETALGENGVSAEIVSVGPPDIVPALARGDIFAGAMFPSFYQGAKKMLAERYREIRVPGYQTRFVLVATREVIDVRPEVVRAVLETLIEAESVVATDPVAAQASVVSVLQGSVSTEDVAAAWGDYDHRIGLDASLLDLMVQEGLWIHGRGSIKGDPPTAESIGAYFAPDFLADIDATRVALN